MLTLQNVGVHFEASPKIVENIDKAMDGAAGASRQCLPGRFGDEEYLNP